MTTTILALIAAIAIPGTTEHGNIRPRDIVSTNVEQTVGHIVGQKGYATTNQVARAAEDAKDGAVNTAKEYTDEQIEAIQTQIDDIPTDAKNYTDKATNATLEASKKYTDNATNAVLDSSKEYTDSEVSKIIKQIDYPVTSVNGKKGDVNLTSDDIGAVKIGNFQPSNLTEYIDAQDANILVFAEDYDNQMKDSLESYTDKATNAVRITSEKYTDDAVDGLATEDYVNAKANAAYVAASQNATNYCNVFLDQLIDLTDTMPEMINDGVVLAISNSNAYTDKAIGATKLPITDRQGSLTNTAISEIKGPLVTDNYFGEIIGELEENFINNISGNNNAIFTDYTNKIAIASHDTLTNANAYTDKKVKAIQVTEEDPVFERWRTGYSIAVGNNANAASGDSIALGDNTRADYYATAIGNYSKASTGTITIGNNNDLSEAIGMSRYAIGHDIISTNGGSIAIGYGVITHGDFTVNLGANEMYLGYSKYANIADRLNILYLGDYNAGDIVDAKINNYVSNQLANRFIQKGYEEDPKFAAWTNDTYKILIGKNATANITASDASVIVIGSGSIAGDHSIALGEAIDGGKNNISIGSSVFHSDTTNNIVIGNLSGNTDGGQQKFGCIVIGSNAFDYFGDSIVLGYGAESHLPGSINIGSEALFTEYGYTNVAEKASAIWFGDDTLGNILGAWINPEIRAQIKEFGKLSIVDSAPTAVEHGKFYCFRPNSTAATAISLSPTFDNGKEDEAKLYLDYTTARSNITVSDSTITVLYEPNSYKLNAFDAPNGQSNRYIVELKWFATTATEDGTKQKFLIVNAKKVSE